MGPAFSTTETKAVWLAQERFDNVSFPVLWMGWNEDFPFSINSNSRSYLDTKDDPKTVLAMLSGIGHSHSSAWTPVISYRFADWVVNGGPGLVKLNNEPSGRDFSFTVTLPPDMTSISARFFYIEEEMTFSLKPGNLTTTMDQSWRTGLCTVSGNSIAGRVPASAHSYYVEVTVTTLDGDFVSTSSLVTPG